MTCLIETKCADKNGIEAILKSPWLIIFNNLGTSFVYIHITTFGGARIILYILNLWCQDRVMSESTIPYFLKSNEFPLFRAPQF